MCGIFGFSGSIKDKNFSFKDLINFQLNLSLKRGREGFGLFLNINDKFHVLNEKNIVDENKSLDNFNKNLNSLLGNNENLEYFGQTRLPTIGDVKLDINTVPILTKNIYGIHNGNIFFNDIDFNNLEFSKKSDSRIFFDRLDEAFSSDQKNFDKNLLKVFNDIDGEANICFFLKTNKTYYLYSNTGSFYYITDKNFILFLSEFYFLKCIKKNFSYFKKYEIFNLKNSTIKFKKGNFIKL